MAKLNFPKGIPGFPQLVTNPVLVARYMKWAGMTAVGMVNANIIKNRPYQKKPEVKRTVNKLYRDPQDLSEKSWLRDWENKQRWPDNALGTMGQPQSLIIIDYEEWKSSGDRPQSSKTSYSYITLNTVPSELEFTPTPNYATIASIGRNAPFYHYTGSEDTLVFKLDWYAKEENRADVIRNCRWLATRSKSEGYYGDPHRVIIVWGDRGLFATDTWVITKASYKLSQFQRHQGMLPNQAYQEVELKKVIETNTNYGDHAGIDFNEGKYYNPMDKTQ